MIYTGVKNFGKALEFFKMVSATHLLCCHNSQLIGPPSLPLVSLRVSLCPLSC
jgi:hypothetical protein